jgi:PhnB protein
MFSRYGDMPPTEGVTLSEAEKLFYIISLINEYTIMGSDVNDQFVPE